MSPTNTLTALKEAPKEKARQSIRLKEEAVRKAHAAMLAAEESLFAELAEVGEAEAASASAEARTPTTEAEEEAVSAPPEPERISIRQVSKVFPGKAKRGSRPQPFTALSNITLDVRDGEFLSIVGPSGCGKSTLLDILAGLEPATSGEVSIDGTPITGPDQRIGIVLQGYALFPWRTVRKNIEFGLEIKEVAKQERHAVSQKYIELVGLEGFEDNYPYELSGGMKQRVAIARALAYDPEVLLMDEPFAAVDAQTRETLQDELMRIWEKTHKTVIFVTHSIEEAVLLGDRIVVMTPHPGRIKEVIQNDLPRPRSASGMRASEEFTWISYKIWELLHNDDALGGGGTDSPAPAGKPGDKLEEKISPAAVI